MKLLASDFDGTLLRNDIITKQDLEAIKKFRENGNLFVISTGRAIIHAYNELIKRNVEFDYIIGVNGIIATNNKKEEIFSLRFDDKVVDKVKEIINKHDIEYYHLSNGIEHIVISKDDNKKYFDDIRGYYISTVSSDAALELVDELNNELKEIGVKAYANNNFVAIGLDGIHKGYGIKRLVDDINFKGKIYVVGDDFNDIPMFTRFDSFGIKSGYSDAIKFAKELVDSVSDVIYKIDLK